MEQAFTTYRSLYERKLLATGVNRFEAHARALASEKALRRRIVAKGSGPHKFSSTQFDLLPSDKPVTMALILKMALAIPEDDLAEEGRELEPHITVKYGLHTDNPFDVEKVVSGFGPVTMKLGDLRIFPADEKAAQRGGAAQDVLYLNVISPDLVRLNAKLCELDHTDTHPNYIPHICIAYLKPGLGKKYMRINTDLEWALTGEEFTFRYLTFSSKDGSTTKIDLTEGGVQLRGNPMVQAKRCVRKDKENYFAVAKDGKDCSWVTIQGAHVCIGDRGKIQAGPAALTGKPVDKLPKRPHSEQTSTSDKPSDKNSPSAASGTANGPKSGLSDPNAANANVAQANAMSASGPKSNLPIGTAKPHFMSAKDVPEGHAPPPEGESLAPAPCCLYKPDPSKLDKDGVAAHSRVGLPANDDIPPDRIPRLPNLTSSERQAETNFAKLYLKHKDKLVDTYRRKQNNVVGKDKDGNPIYEIGDAPNIFNTDDAKLLSSDYNPCGGNSKRKNDKACKESKATLNIAVHQTANAIARAAFVKHLDDVVSKLPDDRKTVLVTSGGVAAGKGYALKSTGLMNSAGAIWDAAGEQNATENEWVLRECKKRGLKPVFAFIHADPKNTWENPERGVVERAGKVGRMVDARLFSDSYALGARNFHAFHEKHKDSGDAEFLIMDNTGKSPAKLDAVPDHARNVDAEELYAHAVAVIREREHKLPPAVVRGGTIGERVWGKPKVGKQEKGLRHARRKAIAVR